MTTVEVPVERLSETAPVEAPAWREHALALARDRDLRRAGVAALLVALQLCVWRFPFPGEVRLLGAIWRHPALLAEAAAVRLSGFACALAGTLALALPLAGAVWLAVPRWRAHTRPAGSAALALDLCCAALAPWVTPLHGSVVARTAQAALAGWLGSPAAAAALLLALAVLSIVVGFRLGPVLGPMLGVAARWGQGQLARGGEAAERSLARGVRQASAAAALGEAKVRARWEGLEERRRRRAEHAAAEPSLTPGGTWIEGAGEPLPEIEPEEGDGALERAADRMERARSALASTLRYHRASIRRHWARWQTRWNRRQPTSRD